MDANDIPRVGLRVREATIADADALSELEILARPGDPSWTYRYTYREEFPEDHQRFNRAKYDGILNALSPFRIMIAEDAGKPVALSIWDLSRVRQGEVYSTSSRPRPASNERRDQNPQRVKAFVETHDRARPFFFDNGFAPGGYIYCTVRSSSNARSTLPHSSSRSWPPTLITRVVERRHSWSGGEWNMPGRTK